MKIAGTALVVALTAAVSGVEASKCHPRPPVNSSSLASESVSGSSSASAYPTASDGSATSSSSSVTSPVSTATSSTALSSISSTTFTTLSTSTSSGSVTGSSVSSPSTSTSSSTIATTSSSATTPTTSSTIPASSTTASSFNPTGYTFVNVALPVVFDGTASSKLPATSTYTLVPATKTGAPTCVLDTSAANSATIKVTDNSGRRFVPKDSGATIGVLDDNDFLGSSSPTESQQISDSLVFQIVGPGSNGRYSLSIPAVDDQGAPITYYVGYIIATGQAITIQRPFDAANDIIATSIFDFTCDGQLTVYSTEGDQLTWEVNPDGSGSLIMTTGPPSPELETLFVVAKAPSSPAPAGKKRSHLATMPLAPSLAKRMSPYTDGTYPRLPSTPIDMSARPRPGARQMGSTNFGTCGTGSTSPAGNMIFTNDFSSCCVLHSYCFDNCATGAEQLCSPGSLTGGAEEYCYPGEFERCNAALSSCALGTVCGQLSWSTQPTRRSQCELEAGYLEGAVATSAGGELFDQATSDRCGGYCSPSGAPFCGGNDAGGDPTKCAPSDDNANCEECGQSCNAAQGFACSGSKCTCTLDTSADDQNCGACGNVCPQGTRCSGGSCVCADQTCAGNVCVDTQTHPRNCGVCGTVCASGYCDAGVCVDPASLPPSKTGPNGCLATDAVMNGGFDTVTSSTVAPPWVVQDLANGGAITFVTRINGNSVAKYSLSTSGTATLTQTMTVCPGASYALEYTVGTSGIGSLMTTLSWTAADGSAQSRPLNGADFAGVVDTSANNNLSPSGPFQFTVPEGVTSMQLAILGRARNPRLPVQILLDEVTVYQP